MASETDDTPGRGPAMPFLTWLTAVGEISNAALNSVDLVTRLSEAQWRMIREALALMSDLPLTAIEESTRNVAQLREALRAVEAQVALVDRQLAAMEEVLEPVREWSRAWQDLVGTNGTNSTDGKNGTDGKS